MKKTICLDFDGVIHEYSIGYDDGSIYDIPVEGSREAVEKMIDNGFEVVIYTARPNYEDIHAWLKKFGFPKLKVIGGKPKAVIYIDDRGLRFTNWRDMLNYLK